MVVALAIGAACAAVAAGALAAGGNNAGDTGSSSLECQATEVPGSHGQNVSWSPTILWPPNHTLQSIAISLSDTEFPGYPDGDLTVTVNSITSSDGFVGTAANGVGNSATAPEDGSLATASVTIPAERAGTDTDGNVYDINVTCVDDDGTATQDLTITVPQNQNS
jgi:hypothetical protein